MLVCLVAAPAVVSALALSDTGSAATLSWLLVGAGLQVIAMSTTLLLYYFDFRREAFVAAVTQFVANGALTALVGDRPGFIGAGYAVACLLTCGVSILLLRRRLAGLLERTFQSQPYASEDFAASEPKMAWPRPRSA
jgi:uncharacterized membrane protein